MGYPVAYRTSSARRERQLSRPDSSLPPSRPRRDPESRPNENSRRPVPMMKTPGPWDMRLPPLGLPTKQAARRLAVGLATVNPWFRLARGLWDLWDLYNWYQSTRTSNGNWTLGCSDNFEINPLSPCDNYMSGPVFNLNQGTSTTCGLLQQAMTTNGAAYRASFAEMGGNVTQVAVFMLRPPSPPCGIGGRGHHLRHYTRTAGAIGRMPFPPIVVPHFKVDPSPVTPFKRLPTYRPLPGRFEPDPLPVPYPVIPDLPPREWPGADGNNDPSYAPGAATMGDELTRPQWEPLAHREPAAKRVTERKFRGANSLAKELFFDLARAHGKLTDFRDIVGAFHDALPKELQLKGKDKKKIPALLRRVWDNLDKLDGEKALAGVIKELAEDVVGGVGDMFKTKAAANFGWTKQKFHLSARF